MRVAFSPAKVPRKNRLKTALILAALGVLAALGLALGLFLKRAGAPELLAVDPAIGEPGSTIRIVGRNFGPERGESRVEFDDVAPTASSYIRWTDTLIEVRVPLYAESALIRVKTPGGRSNSRMFMSRALLPSRPEGSTASAVAPVINSLSSDSGAVGSIIVIQGLNFGNNRDDSDVLFSWEGAAAFASSDESSGRDYIAPNADDGEYLAWSDKEIKVIVPDGAVSGGLVVRTARGASPIRYFEVDTGPGTKRFLGGRKYSLSSFVTISRVRASGPNELYLWMPMPELSASQRGVKSLGRSHEPYVPDYRGLTVYRLADLASDRLITVSQDFLVQAYTVDTEIKAERVTVPAGVRHPAYELYTRPDVLVPSDHDAMIALAKKAGGKEKNPYRLAKLLLDALLAQVRFDQRADAVSPAQALEKGSGDAWALALAYAALLRASGVPALPVAGVVVSDDRTATAHVWVEFYLSGLGWVPVDPVLYSGASIGGFGSVFEDYQRYFGDLDERHVAFSRGLVSVAPNTPDGRTTGAERRYSMQSAFEESAGALSAYTSFWSDVEVTGIY